MTAADHGFESYTGHRDEVFRHVGEAWETDHYCLDQEGLRSYQFNSLGFRSPEFNPAASFKAFIFGESDTFGLGVDFEDIWAVKVARQRANQAGFGPAQTCIMSFAESGASNSYTVRMLISQCAQQQPDLVLVQISEDERFELVNHNRTFAGGPWLAEPEVEAQIQAAVQLTSAKRAELFDLLAKGRSFLAFDSPQQALFRTLMQLQLLQGFAAGQAADVIVTGPGLERFQNADIQGDPLLGPLARALSPSLLRVLPLGALAEGDRHGLDQSHISKQQHAWLAKYILDGTA